MGLYGCLSGTEGFRKGFRVRDPAEDGLNQKQGCSGIGSSDRVAGGGCSDIALPPCPIGSAVQSFRRMHA